MIKAWVHKVSVRCDICGEQATHSVRAKVFGDVHSWHVGNYCANHANMMSAKLNEGDPYTLEGS
jgi:hypothetical protein